MKRLLSILSILCLLLVPLAAQGAENASGSEPPVEQPLVREGDFAVQLANTLNLTNNDDEAEAESTLAASGILPKNGWIADYPVTPDVLVEIRNAAGDAAQTGKLPLDRQEAWDAVQKVATDLDLSITVADSEYGSEAPPPPPEGDYTVYTGPEDLGEYYDDYGPPVVTYYPPPWDYAYLYDWVPYPFWWGGYGFGGFYVLGDFHRTRRVFEHHHFVTRNITNQVRIAGGRMGRIDPALRASRPPGALARTTAFGGAGINSLGARSGTAGARAILNRGAAGRFSRAAPLNSGISGARMARVSPNVSAAPRTFSSAGVPSVRSGPSRFGSAPARSFAAPRSFGTTRSFGAARSFAAPRFNPGSGGFRTGFSGASRGSFGGHAFSAGRSFGGGGFGGHSFGGGMHGGGFAHGGGGMGRR